MHSYLYYSQWIDKWLILLLIKGKKETAERFVIQLLKYLKLQFGMYPYFILNDFILKNKTVVEVRAYRKSNIFFNVPFPTELNRQYRQNLRWLLISIRHQRKTSFKNTLLNEIIQFFKKKTSLLKKHNFEHVQVLIKSRVYQQYRW
jgi:ribosomal protein S7